MKIPPRKVTARKGNPWQNLKERFAYAFGFTPIRAMLLLLSLFSVMAVPINIFLPIFATKILHGGPQTLGFLMAASGVGALIGGIYLASRRTVVGLGNLIVAAPAIVGVGLIIFALSRTLWLSLIIIAIVGLGSVWQFAATNTVIQTIVEDDKRGRVMSLYTMAFFGAVPIGNLFAGALANQIGAPNTLIVGGIFCIFGSILFGRQLPDLGSPKQVMMHCSDE